MAVQHFDHKQAQDVFSGQGGNQAPGKRDRSVVGHFRGFSRLRARYYRNRGHRGWLVEGLLYDWPGNEG